MCPMRVAVAQREACHGRAEVHVVRAIVGRGALAVVVELGILDQHHSAGVENAVLIVVEIAVADRETRTVGADPRSVLAIVDGYSGPGKLDIFHGGVIGGHPDSLAVADELRGTHVRAAAAHAA